MFGKLPDLIDKNFFIGFFLPAALLMGGVYLCLDAFGRLPAAMEVKTVDDFLGATIVAAIVWLVAILLLALNRPLTRFTEGYAPYPFPFRKAALKGAFRDWQARAEADEKGGIARGFVARFPSQEDDVLATRFGNAYRAIEVHSRDLYGFDAIPAWSRLQAVMPPEFLARLDEAKAQLDFCLNLLWSAAGVGLLYLGLALWQRAWPDVWLLGLALALVPLAYFMARDALVQYGEYVKAAFDLFRRELAEQLGFELPASAESERQMWWLWSQQAIYRSGDLGEELDRFRKKPKPPERR
ncbi:hypothetical protein [Afifella sp. IM 167]|uniref:hypothetical protein n=1 Tax=Afifella sp. IM 167 TaxID=2033586 RepID=UPI001CCB0277|nr:hypothetical protein [Afifella sp. IM 167]MBZ8133951.1 hypothetical protein [Afifella sp. IM 167]